MERQEYGSQCYGCAYREEVTGSAHSMCVFNWAKFPGFDPKGNDIGLKNGWYNFPLNFDPVWMDEKCRARSEEKNPSLVADLSESLVYLLKKMQNG
jgi:hypothetical protein